MPTYFLIGMPSYSAETHGIKCWDLGASFIAPSGLNSAYTVVHHELVYIFGLQPSISVWSENEILLCTKWRIWLRVAFILFSNETDKILNLPDYVWNTGILSLKTMNHIFQHVSTTGVSSDQFFLFHLLLNFAVLISIKHLWGASNNSEHITEVVPNVKNLKNLFYALLLNHMLARGETLLSAPIRAAAFVFFCQDVSILQV